MCGMCVGWAFSLLCMLGVCKHLCMLVGGVCGASGWLAFQSFASRFTCKCACHCLFCLFVFLIISDQCLQGQIFLWERLKVLKILAITALGAISRIFCQHTHACLGWCRPSFAFLMPSPGLFWVWRRYLSFSLLVPTPTPFFLQNALTEASCRVPIAYLGDWLVLRCQH